MSSTSLVLNYLNILVVYISQRKYSRQILKDCGFFGAKPGSHPLVPSLQLSASSGTFLDSISAFYYRRLIGQLLYLQISCPDICFTVHKLSQFIAKPCTEHLKAADHLLHYIKGTTRQGILLKATQNFQLKTFVDYDGRSFPDSRK